MPLDAKNLAESSILSLLEGKTDAEKIEVRADEVFKKAQVGPFTSKYDGTLISILEIEKIEKGVQVMAQAMRFGEQLGFGSDGTIETERFRFINPPFLVPDANGKIEFKYIDRGEEFSDFFVEDPDKALKDALAHAVLLTGRPGNVIPGTVGTTVTTVFSTRDGNFRRNNGGTETWATIRGGAGNGVDDTSAGNGMANLLASSTTDQYQIISRYAFVFATGAVGSDTVSATTLSITGRSPGVIDGFSGSGQLAVVQASVASNTAFANADYEGNVNYTTRWVTTDKDLSAFTTSVYNDFTFNATGMGGINGTGDTVVGVKINFDVDNSPPTWASGSETFARMYSYAQAGTGADPKLTITHAPAGGGPVRDARYLPLLGVG